MLLLELVATDELDELDDELTTDELLTEELLTEELLTDVADELLDVPVAVVSATKIPRPLVPT